MPASEQERNDGVASANPLRGRHALAPAWIARHGGTLVAVAFLALGLATLTDHGITWDEGESYRAGAQNLRLIAAALGGDPLPSWPWHELPGYQFAADTLRAGFAAIVDRAFWEPGSYLGFHLANLLFATLAVTLVARLAAHLASKEGGAPVLAPLAATLLVLQPKLVAHSQANPKDVVALVVWSAAVLALARAARSGRLVDFALLGAAAGAALAHHVSALLLAPFALSWTIAAGAGPWRRRLGGLLLAGVVAAAVALLLWPWLWPAPWERALMLWRKVHEFDVPMKVLYLGRIYRPTELPWHYGWLSLAMATPVPLLLASLAGVAAALRGGPAARLCRLAGLWLGLLLLADLVAPARYDGARHLLPALPALALLAAGGVYTVGLALWRSEARARRAALALGALFAASLVVVAIDLAAIHPYADAYLNAPARLALGPEAQRCVELEYWGASYKEGAEWLTAHAPRDSFVLVPLGSHAAAPFLADRFTLVPHDGSYDTTHPQYLMLMMREAWFTPRLARIAATQRPVFTVRRQDSTLLAIYRVAPLAPAPTAGREPRDFALLESPAMAGSSFTVLVATDFSPTADAAVQWGSELARARGGRLVLVHAVDVHGPLTDFLPSPAELDEQVRTAAAARLEEAAAAVRAQGGNVESRLETGVASQAVVRAAGEIAPDLVVQGSRGLTPGLAHLLLGSTAQRIVQHSPRPVLTVHPGDRDRHAAIRHVLVPTDFSDDAEGAAHAARALLAGDQAAASREPADGAGARLTLLHAYHLPIEYTAYGTIPTSIPFHADVAAVAEEKLAAAAASLAGEAHSVDTVAKEGYPPEVIADTARELDVDLIAMGTHGRTGLRHLLLGSNAERVIEHAPCPVLTVRQPET
ncbi:MAG TPA: universal stress protein [Thermoanaerobaculia bacterium]|nr:universal stress protein [Thermoanaerobaculia bacterium]